MARSYLCITSMSIPIYEQYGRKMIASWLSAWSHLNATLVVYFDDVPPEDFEDGPNLYAASLRVEMPQLFNFQLRHQSPICSGRFGDVYSYRHDAKKFAFKVASVAASICGHDYTNPHETDILIWLDADTVWLKPMTDDFLNNVFPNDAHIGIFQRHAYHTECGIVFYNIRLPIAEQLIEQYWNLYHTDRIFLLPYWNDCDVLDALVASHAKAKTGLQIYNLGTPASIYAAHPIINSPWGHYVDHLKGDRKEVGASRPSDRVLPI